MPTGGLQLRLVLVLGLLERGPYRSLDGMLGWHVAPSRLDLAQRRRLVWSDAMPAERFGPVPSAIEPSQGHDSELDHLVPLG